MDLPVAWMEQFDGGELEERSSVSAILATVAEDSWAHAAYLSVGEILALPPDRVRVCLWPSSGTARHIEANERACLHVAVNGAVQEVRLQALNILRLDQLLLIEFQVLDVRQHRAPYAHVHAMIDFKLLDIPKTLERWRGQIAALERFHA